MSGLWHFRVTVTIFFFGVSSFEQSSLSDLKLDHGGKNATEMRADEKRRNGYDNGYDKSILEYFRTRTCRKTVLITQI